MPLSVVEGDLFQRSEPALVCPTNSVGAMGAGLARSFAERYPGLAVAYREACYRGRHDAMHPFVWQGQGATVVCIATKRHWRDPSRLCDVEAGAAALRRTLLALGLRRVALPALGCGLGGLRLEAVQRTLERTFADGAVDAVLVLPSSAATPLG